MDSGRPAALLLSPETPYPLQGGGALRTASILHYLSRSHDVDLIVFRHRADQDPAAAIPAGLVRRVCTIDLPHHGRDFRSRAWRNAGRVARGVPPLVDRFRGFEQPVARFVSGQRYQVGVIEHFWCAEYLPLLRRVSDAVVLNLHNVESVLHATSAGAEGGWAPWVHGRFAQKCRAMERRWLPRFDEVLTASEADAQRVRRLAPESKTRVFPNAIPWTARPERPEGEIVAFSGNLEYHPNQIAVAYFYNQIWPALRDRRPGLTWRLIGMNPDAVRGVVARPERVEWTGSVFNAVEELAAARVVVVPLLSGSGTRLKIVEAWAAGRAIVSTTLGAEGLPARHEGNILLADTPGAFIASVERLLMDGGLRCKLGDAGRLEFEGGFCWQAAWDMLDKSLLSNNPRSTG